MESAHNETASLRGDATVLREYNTVPPQIRFLKPFTTALWTNLPPPVASQQLLTPQPRENLSFFFSQTAAYYYRCCCLTITEITAGGAVLLHQLAPAVAIASPSPARTYKKAVQTSWKETDGFRGKGGGRIRPQLSLSNKKKLVHQSALWCQ